MEFPKDSYYQYNYYHFTEDVTAAEILPVFPEIFRVNYIFSSGMQKSKEIYQGLSYFLSGMIRLILDLPSVWRKYQLTETVTHKIR